MNAHTIQLSMCIYKLGRTIIYIHIMFVRNINKTFKYTACRTYIYLYICIYIDVCVYICTNIYIQSYILFVGIYMLMLYVCILIEIAVHSCVYLCTHIYDERRAFGRVSDECICVCSQNITNTYTSYICIT